MCRILPRTEKANCVISYKRLGSFAKLATTYNVMPFPSSRPANDREGAIECQERLGGLLKYYHRKAA
jgi:hypothetical protein